MVDNQQVGLNPGSLGRELTIADVIRTAMTNRGTTQDFTKDGIDALMKLSWDSDNFLGELFSNTSSKIDKDKDGKFKFTPTSEGILSCYDNGTSLTEVGQYFLGVPIAALATKTAQETFMQDVAGGMAFQAELKQLSKTIEDYTNLMMALQLGAPEKEKADEKTLAKYKKELEDYKAKHENGLNEKYDRDIYIARLTEAYKSMSKFIQNNPRILQEYQNSQGTKSQRGQSYATPEESE
jgi:hypothetical protein